MKGNPLKGIAWKNPSVIAGVATAGLVAAVTSYAVLRGPYESWYINVYLNPPKEKHIAALLTASITEYGVQNSSRAISVFLDGGWAKYLTSAEKQALLAKQQKYLSLISAIDSREKAVTALKLNQELQRKAIEEDKRVQYYETTLTNCFVDAPCDRFPDRIGRVEGGVFHVADVKCKLQGEPGDQDGYGACSVSMEGGRPVAARFWDPKDGFVTSTVVVGKRTKVVDKEKLANPYIAIQQQRIGQMISDFQAERENGDRNCKGLEGQARVECYGAQTP